MTKSGKRLNVWKQKKESERAQTHNTEPTV